MAHRVFFRRIASLFVCTSLACSTIALAETPPPAGVVTALSGEATLSHATAPDRPLPLKFRDDLFFRDLIRTKARSIARVLLGGKAVVTVRALSELTILQEPQQPMVVDLADGKVAVAVSRTHMKPGEEIRVRTPNAIAAVRGTVAVVSYLKPEKVGDPPQTSVSCFEGPCVVTDQSGKSTTLQDGQTLIVAASSSGAPGAASSLQVLFGDLTSPLLIGPVPQAIIQEQTAMATTLAQIFAPAPSSPPATNPASTQYSVCQQNCGGGGSGSTPSPDLVIPPSYTSLANETFNTVTHSAGAGNDTLDGSFNLTATGLYTWSGGTMQGTGTTLAQGGLLMTGPGSPTLSRTLQLGDGATAGASAFGLTGGGALLFNNGSLVVLNAHTLNLTTGMGFTAVGGANAVTINSGGGLVVNSGATNTIQPPLINDGTVLITSGTLQLAGGGSGSGTVILANAAATALDLSNNNITTGSLSGGGALGGNVILGSGTLTTGDATNTTFGGMISGTGGLTKQGAGTFTLSGANTYTGLTTVNAGTLSVSGGNALLDTGAVNVTAAGATFNLASSEMIGSLTGVAGSAVTLNANTLTTGDASNTTFAGVISGTGSLTKQGSGTFTLSGANTYTGQTTINAGTLSVSGGSALADTGAVNVAAAGATFDLASSETIGSLTGVAGSALTLNANTLTTGDASNTTFAGVLSGTGGLTKQGTGTFTLSGADTYSGLTTVNAGTLLLTGGNPSTGSFTVASGSQLQFGGGTYNLNAGTLLSGAGAVDITAGTVNFNAGTGYRLTGTTTVSGGALAASGDLVGLGASEVFSPAGAMLMVSGGALTTGGSVLNIPATATLTLSASALAVSLTGSVTSNAPLVSVGGTLDPIASPLFQASDTASITTIGAGSHLVSVPAGGSLTLSGQLLQMLGSAPTVTAGGDVLNVAGTVTGPLGGLSLLDVAAGTLSTTGALANLAGSGTTLSGPLLAQTGGSISAASGLTLASGASLTPTGGLPVFQVTGGTLNVSGHLASVSGILDLSSAGPLLSLPSGAPTVTIGGNLLNVAGGPVTGPGGGASLINVAATSATGLTVGGALVHLPSGGAGFTLSGPLLAQTGGVVTVGTISPGFGVIDTSVNFSTPTSALVQVSGTGTLSTVGQFVVVPGGFTLTVNGPLLSLPSGTPSVSIGIHGLTVAGTLTGLTTGPLFEVAATGPAGFSVAPTSPFALVDLGSAGNTLAGAILTQTGGLVSMPGLGLFLDNNAALTTGTPALFQVSGTGTLAAGTLAVVNPGATLTLGGPLLDLPSGTPSVTVGADVLNVSGTSTVTGPGGGQPLINVGAGSLTVTGALANLAGSGTTLSGPLLTQSGGTITAGTGLNVGPGGVLGPWTLSGPLFQVTGGALSTTGNVVNVPGGAALTLDHTLLSASGTGSVAIAGAGVDVSGTLAVTGGPVVQVSGGGQLTTTGSSALLNVNGGTITAPSGLLQVGAGGTVSLAGPGLSATGGTIDTHNSSYNTAVGSPVGVGSAPQFVAVSDDLRLAYVTNSASNTLSVIDPTANTVLVTIPVGSNPVGVATGVPFSQSSFRAYVANLNDNTVSVIDTTSNALLTTISTGIGTSPERVAVSANGNNAYVTNLGSTFISVINTASNTATTVDIGSTNALGVAVTADGSRAYVVIGGGSPSVKVIDTSTFAVSTIAGLGTSPAEIAMAPNGTRAYVANFGSNSLSVIDTNPAHTIANGFSSNTYNTVIATIGGLSGAPQGIAMNASGSRLYVTEANGNVELIDPFTNRVAATFSGGTNPTGVAFTPDGTRIVVAATGSNQVTVFDSNSGGSMLAITSGASLTSTGAAPLLQLTGSTVTAGGGAFVRVIDAGSSLTLAGSLLAATDTTFTTTNLGNFLSVLDGASVTTSGTSAPLLSFTGTGPGLSSVTTDRNFISIGQTFAGTSAPSVTLSGPLLNATQTNFAIGDPTKNTFTFLFVGDSATVTSTGTAPLLSFDNSAVDTAGGILSLRRSTSTSLPSTLTLAGPLFSATNGSSFNTTSLGNVTSACCTGFSISQGTALASSTTQPLIQLTNSTFNAGPDSQSGGNFFNISDTGGPAGELVAPASATLAGPLLSATGGSISALFSGLQVGRSSLSSSSPNPLILLDGTTVTLGGLDPIAGVPARGRLLNLFASAATPASLVLQGPLLGATNATLSSTDIMFGFFDGSTFTSTTASPLISFAGSSATAGAGALAGLSGNFISVGSGSLHLPPIVTFAGSLLSATNATLSNWDPNNTAAAYSFTFIGDSAQVTNTTDVPLFSFDDSHLSASGPILSLRRSLSVPAPTKLTLTGPLFVATNGSAFSTTGRGNEGAGATCCDAFFVSQGAQLTSSTSTPLIQLTSSSFNAGPDAPRSGGDFFGVFNTFSTAGGTELVAPASVSLAGPLLSATDSAISSLFSTVSVERSTLTSSGAGPLIMLVGSLCGSPPCFTAGGLDPISGKTQGGNVLFVQSATSSGSPASPGIVSLAGGLLDATNATIGITGSVVGVSNGATVTSIGTGDFLHFTNTTLTAGHEPGFGGDNAFRGNLLGIGGTGGATGLIPSSLTLNGRLATIDGSGTLTFKDDMVAVFGSATFTLAGCLLCVNSGNATLTVNSGSFGSGDLLRVFGTVTDTASGASLLSIAAGSNPTLTVAGSLVDLQAGGALNLVGPLLTQTGGSISAATALSLAAGATLVPSLSSNALTTNVPVGSSPADVAVTRDGSRAYVTNVGSNNVSVIDTATNTVIATVAVGSPPLFVAITPDGSRAYVTRFAPNRISVIDTATNTAGATVVLGSQPNGIAITPDGSQAYVTLPFANSVAVLDTTTNTVTTTVAVGSQPSGVAVSPNGSRAYVTNQFSNTVSVIDTTTYTVVATVAVGANPYYVAVTPDGSRVYVPNYLGNTVSVINTATNSVVATVPVGTNPLGIALSPDGTRAYVANQGSNNVSVIATVTNTVVATVAVGAGPVGIAAAPGGTGAYVVNQGPSTVSVIGFQFQPLLQVTGGTLTTTGNLVSIPAGASFTLDAPLLDARAPGQVIVAGDVLNVSGTFTGGGDALIKVTGTNTAVDAESGLTLGTDQPLQPGGALVSASGAGAVVTLAQALKIDTALLEATLPLLNLTAGATMTSSQDVFNLLQKANLTSTGTSVVKLDASTLYVNNGALFNVAGGSKLKTTGDLILLSGGALLDIRNGTILYISGNSFTSIGGGLVNLGAGGGTLKVSNNLCPCINFSGVQVALTGGAVLGNISITNPLKNGASITYGTPTAAAIVISGSGSKLTITGN